MESDPTRDISVFSTVERKDVGIILRLTPQVTEGDHVRLEIYQEISAIIDQADIVDISVGPSTTKRSTKTTVVVQDNQTVVIGGLMEERLEEKINKVPLLGDIPLLGWLFKNKSYEKKKVNLFVFLSPHVIHDSEALAELTEEKKNQYARAEDKYVQGEVVVKFKGGIPDERISEILSDEDAAIIRELQPNGLYLVKLEEKEDVKEAIEKFTTYEEVQYAEPNYIMTIQ